MPKQPWRSACATCRALRPHWEGQNPWVDEQDREIPGFIEAVASARAYYQRLKKKYGNDTAAIDREMNRRAR